MLWLNGEGEGGVGFVAFDGEGDEGDEGDGGDEGDDTGLEQRCRWLSGETVLDIVGDGPTRVSESVSPLYESYSNASETFPCSSTSSSEGRGIEDVWVRAARSAIVLRRSSLRRADAQK